MSRVFRKNNKDLIKLDVVDSSKVWVKNKNGSFVMRKDIDVFGRIEKGTSAFVTKPNLKGKMKNM